MARRENAHTIHLDSFGSGYPLVLGYPLSATTTDGAVLDGYLDALAGKFRVLVLDYPNIGESVGFPAQELTRQNVCRDILAALDTAGVDRFVWMGFSWGGVVGIQLASSSDRVSALICGGWPPLGGFYSELLEATRTLSAAAPNDISIQQFRYFYESLQGWDEGSAVGQIKCPRMAYVGSEDEVDLGGIKIPLTERFRERRFDIERHGWRVVEIPGEDHSVFSKPEKVMPEVCDFLDQYDFQSK